MMMRSATVSAPSLKIAMMPGTAAGMAGGRVETGIVETGMDETGIGMTGMVETGIDVTGVAVAIGGIEDARGSTTGITGGLTRGKSIARTPPDSVEVKPLFTKKPLPGSDRGCRESNSCFLDTL